MDRIPVKAICTYCSKEKDKDPRILPAIERYRSKRIKLVSQKADTNKIQFVILSGRLALSDPYN